MTATPRSILHVTVGLDYGGVERALLAIATAQKSAGHDVSVFALRRGGPIADKMRDAGIDVVVGSEAADIRKTPRGNDVIHTHLFAADALMRSLERITPLLKNAALTTTWHGVLDSYPFGIAARASAPRLYGGFDARVAVSAAVRTSWCAFTHVDEADVHVVPNPVAARTPSTKAMNAARAAFGDDAPLKLACVGRLVDDKRFDLAIEALGLPALRARGARLVIVGEGPRYVDLETLAQNRGVRDRVVFVESQPEPEAFYAAADVVVMPSAHEGFGLVAVEAAAQGTPVAATRNDGLADALAGCPGPAIASLDASSVANAIVGCAPIDDRERASFLETYRAWAKEMTARYAPERVQRALDAVYDDAMANARARRERRRWR